LSITQLDFQNAFLNGKLEGDDVVYMNYPPGFPGEPGTVLKLNKALYGLKTAPRIWYLQLKQALQELGFNPTEKDRCVFIHNTETFYITMHVDDLILATDNLPLRAKVVQMLGDKYKMTDLGRLHKYLGVRAQHLEDGSIILSQEQYLRDTLKKYEMEGCNPVDTPMEQNLHLSKTQCPTTPSKITQVASVPYRAVVGSLNYALTCTRPDLAYSLISCARYVANPGKEHWVALKRVLRYVAGTLKTGIRFQNEGDKLGLMGMSDSDWAGDPDTRRSRLGYVIFLAGGPISWKSTQQKTAPAQSSTEAEYLALVELMKEMLWVHHLLVELRVDTPRPIEIFLDNDAAKSIASATRNMKAIKHVDTRYLTVRQYITDGLFKLYRVPSSENIADLFTKSTSRPIFKHLSPKLIFDTNKMEL
jgi:hypothetical protein